MSRRARIAGPAAFGGQVRVPATDQVRVAAAGGAELVLGEPVGVVERGRRDLRGDDVRSGLGEVERAEELAAEQADPRVPIHRRPGAYGLNTVVPRYASGVIANGTSRVTVVASSPSSVPSSSAVPPWITVDWLELRLQPLRSNRS